MRLSKIPAGFWPVQSREHLWPLDFWCLTQFLSFTFSLPILKFLKGLFCHSWDSVLYMLSSIHSLQLSLHVFRLKIIHTCRCLEDFFFFCFITQYKVSWNMVSVHCCWSLCGSGQEGSSGQKYFALSLQLASAAPSHILMSCFMSLSITVLLLPFSLAIFITQSVLFGVISGN